MYTLEDIYNRLDAGTPGAKRTGAFAEPVAGPGSSGHTVDEIMVKAPATNAAAATASEVLAGRVFWGLQSGAWGQQSGTVPAGAALNGADGALVITITDGLYSGSKTATASDTDLVTGNIRSGVNIFGVAGAANVVNTSSGDATAGDILALKKAWVDGAEVTGSMATRTLSPANDTVQAGYYAATTLSAVDADLAAGNIKAGASIFGVNGNVIQATGNAAAADVLSGRTFSHATGSGTGTMPNRTGNVTAQSRTVSGTTLRFRPQAGYYDGASGNSVQRSDSNFTAENIRSGVSVFGVTGTYVPAESQAAVPKTGQTTSYRTRDDGNLKRGFAWPNPRFTDHGNTVTDNLTGLMWTKNANLPNGTITWDGAIDYCNGMNSGAGTYGYTDWRLPNVRELQSLIDYGNFSPALPSGHPFTNVQNDWYWSSSTRAAITGSTWFVTLDGGVVNSGPKTYPRRVWPVRAGQ